MAGLLATGLKDARIGGTIWGFAGIIAVTASMTAPALVEEFTNSMSDGSNILLSR